MDWTFFFVGEGGEVEFDEDLLTWAFFCAALDGRAAVVTVLVFVFCDWRATLTRFGRLVDWESCVEEEAAV